MELKSRIINKGNGNAPNDPEKDIPTKPDKNPDPTKPRPGGNEPNKIDPTRIEEPKKNDPTRIHTMPTRSRLSSAKQGHKWTKVNSWEEAIEKMKL